jgi:hypothetical protein
MQERAKIRGISLFPLALPDYATCCRTFSAVTYIYRWLHLLLHKVYANWSYSQTKGV